MVPTLGVNGAARVCKSLNVVVSLYIIIVVVLGPRTFDLAADVLRYFIKFFVSPAREHGSRIESFCCCNFRGKSGLHVCAQAADFVIVAVAPLARFAYFCRKHQKNTIQKCYFF